MGRMVASVGNWNGDVYDDFIVGLPGIGAAMVLYGSSTFASTTNATNVMDTQVGGFAIAAGVDDVRRAGDFNNDGYDDVILGEKESDEAYILFGTSNISSYISTPAAYGSEMVDITDGLSLSGSGANLQSGGSPVHGALLSMCRSRCASAHPIFPKCRAL